MVVDNPAELAVGCAPDMGVEVVGYTLDPEAEVAGCALGLEAEVCSFDDCP